MDDLVVNPALQLLLTVRSWRKGRPLTTLSIRHDEEFDLFDWLMVELANNDGGAPATTELPEPLLRMAMEAGILVRRDEVAPRGERQVG